MFIHPKNGMKKERTQSLQLYSKTSKKTAKKRGFIAQPGL